MKVKVKSLSRVRLFTIPWTAAYQENQGKDVQGDMGESQIYTYLLAV